MLSCLIYVSEAKKNIKDKDLTEILDTSLQNNRKNNITGMLLFNGKQFMQYIEGDRCDINRLFKNIVNDTRHSNVEIILSESIKSKRFRNWSMAHLKYEGRVMEILNKYNGKKDEDFDYFSLTSEQAEGLLAELSVYYIMNEKRGDDY